MAVLGKLLDCLREPMSCIRFQTTSKGCLDSAVRGFIEHAGRGISLNTKPHYCSSLGDSKQHYK